MCENCPQTLYEEIRTKRTISNDKEQLVLHRLETAGFSLEQAEAIIQSSNNELAAKIIQFLKGQTKAKTVIQSDQTQEQTEIKKPVLPETNTSNDLLLTFSITVDYDQSIKDLVEFGNYRVHPGITDDHFPTQNKGKVQLELVLVHFNRPISRNEAIKELEKMGLWPARLKELLSFGAQYPDKQKEFPIIALGQTWRDPNGHCVIPCLCWYSECELRLDWVEYDWDSGCRFLAFRHRTGA